MVGGRTRLRRLSMIIIGYKQQQQQQDEVVNYELSNRYESPSDLQIRLGQQVFPPAWCTWITLVEGDLMIRLQLVTLQRTPRRALNLLL